MSQAQETAQTGPEKVDEMRAAAQDTKASAEQRAGELKDKAAEKTGEV